MGKPERQVRRKGKNVQQPIVRTSSANFDHSPGGGGEVLDIVLRV